MSRPSSNLLRMSLLGHFQCDGDLSPGGSGIRVLSSPPLNWGHGTTNSKLEASSDKHIAIPILFLYRRFKVLPDRSSAL
jgi:hypothetical protein